MYLTRIPVELSRSPFSRGPFAATRTYRGGTHEEEHVTLRSLLAGNNQPPTFAHDCFKQISTDSAAI